jgi:hypothetical protein
MRSSNRSTCSLSGTKSIFLKESRLFIIFKSSLDKVLFSSYYLQDNLPQQKTYSPFLKFLPVVENILHIHIYVYVCIYLETYIEMQKNMKCLICFEYY